MSNDKSGEINLSEIAQSKPPPPKPMSNDKSGEINLSEIAQSKPPPPKPMSNDGELNLSEIAQSKPPPPKPSSVSSSNEKKHSPRPGIEVLWFQVFLVTFSVQS